MTNPPRNTGDIVSSIVDAVTEADGEVVGAVKGGRRRWDWRAIFSPRAEISVFFYVFGMFLDDRHKPSMLRIMLWVWTGFGCLMLLHELHLLTAQSPLQNVVWDAWWKVEGVLILNIGGVGIASYFAPGAAGAISLAGAVRDVAAKAGIALPHEGKI